MSGKRFPGCAIQFAASRAAAWLMLAAMLSTVGIANAAPKPAAIENAGSLFRLGNEAARAAIPVRIKAQITFVDAPWGILFVQDATGSMYVGIKPGPARLAPGDVLAINGVSAPGAVGPIVMNAHLRVLRPGALPKPLQIDPAALQAGMADSRYVITRGILRPGPDLWDHTSLTLVDGPTSIPIMIPGGKNAAADPMIGAMVTVRAVNAAHLDSSNRRLGSSLFVSKLSDIVIEQPGWNASEAIPVTAITSLSAPKPGVRFLSAIHIHGFVLWRGAKELLVGDQTGAVYVQTPNDLPVERGARVDVIGFLERQGSSTIVTDALVRGAGSALAPLPPVLSVTADRLAQAGRDGERVRLQGRLISQETRKTDFVLTASDAGTTFSIRLPLTHDSDQLVRLAPQSIIQCDGMLHMFPAHDGKPASFELLIDSPSQIQVNTGHASVRVLVGILVPGIIFGILLWIIQLNRALRSKTARIREQLEHEVQLETRYRRLFERNLAAVFSWLPSGEITDCNRAFANLLGFTSTGDVVGKSYWSFCVSSSPDGTADPDHAAENGRETALRRADGKIVHILEQVSRVGSGPDAYYETTALDVTQAREHRAELQRARDAAQREAERDALTGLPNRRKFSQLLDQATAQSQASRVPISLLYMDLDGFKMVNDTLGHGIGDLLLLAVGDRLRARMGSGNTLCRIGGDEFAILITHPQDARAPEQLAQFILQVFQSAFEIGGHHLAVGASIGISSFPEPASSATSLMQQADAAMYVAKRAGKNQAATYSEEIGTSLGEKNRILTELKKAVDLAHIELHYQPEFDARTAELVRFEALARWNNRHLGQVPPQKFIAIAEECGFLRQLGAYLMERACRDAVRWHRATGREIPVAVNVSNLQLRSPSFAAELFDVLERTGLRPDLLELEMTESVMIDDFQRTRVLLSNLRSAGVRLALDDFGTGYSCLDYLSELKFDRLKVAPSFLRKADLDRGSAALMTAVVNVAHALDTKIVVEGIETARELQFVKRLGADEVQGFLLGRPTADPVPLIRKHCHTAAPASPQPARPNALVPGHSEA